MKTAVHFNTETKTHPGHFLVVSAQHFDGKRRLDFLGGGERDGVGFPSSERRDVSDGAFLLDVRGGGGGAQRERAERTELRRLPSLSALCSRGAANTRGRRQLPGAPRAAHGQRRTASTGGRRGGAKGAVVARRIAPSLSVLIGVSAVLDFKGSCACKAKGDKKNVIFFWSHLRVNSDRNHLP